MRFPRRYELCIYIYIYTCTVCPLPICGTKFTASCDNIIESCVKEGGRYRLDYRDCGNSANRYDCLDKGIDIFGMTRGLMDGNNEEEGVNFSRGINSKEGSF